jgi:hypothetical protein
MLKDKMNKQTEFTLNGYHDICTEKEMLIIYILCHVFFCTNVMISI